MDSARTPNASISASPARDSTSTPEGTITRKGLDPAGLGKCLGDRGGIQFSNSMADAGKVGIGYDIWATCTPERDAVTTRIYAPRVGASQCTIRGDPPAKALADPQLRVVRELKDHAMRLEDFSTVRSFLQHRQRVVFGDAYGLATVATLSNPNQLRVVAPESDLNVFKTIPPQQFHACIRRQAHDRGLRVERDYRKMKHIADELHQEGHRTKFYTFMDQHRNIVIATDSYEFPTHDASDSAFLRWLARYGLLERVETYKGPSQAYVIEELGWNLIRPTIYIVRMLPGGNVDNSCARTKIRDKDTHKHFASMRRTSGVGVQLDEKEENRNSSPQSSVASFGAGYTGADI
mmetsp:Transcript_7474/g.14170  ORF Transcript_7474/g.14170 Transcript_7474/m.14170 type:complete len:349 (+) Transcript_7474:243-1289(+)